MVRNKKGFTLVELIVVIAILGVLAAIVVPRVGEFRNQAEISHDRTTMRAVQGSINMYHAQHGVFPGISAAGVPETPFAAGASAANYTNLNTLLNPFLDLRDGEMPLARSRQTSGDPVREFQYDPVTGLISILPVIDAPVIP